MPLHEIEQKIDRAVGAISSRFFCNEGTIAVISGVGVAGSFILGMPGVKEAIFIKSGLVDMHAFPSSAVGVGEVGWVV